MNMRSLCGVALAVGLTAGVAAAQPDYKAAAEHYQLAETAMARGAYTDAALEYGIAYDITKDPILFFKIGQANDKAGRCAVALTYYNRYLKEGNPSPEYRRLTEERVVACGAAGTDGGTGDGGTGDGGTGDGGTGDGGTGDGGTGDGGTGDGGTGDGGAGDGSQDGALGGPDAGGPSFIDQPQSWKRTGAWVATGLTVGLAAAGVVLAMSASGSEEDLQQLLDFRTAGRPARYDEVRGTYDSLLDDGERYDQLATVAFIGAGATAVIATTLFLLDRGGRAESAKAARIRPAVDRRGGGVVVGWEF
ncbi:MAG: hypothetical protein KBG48_22330 [Kofleriaceae bacterium]|nr:hypothetical protein [Kofleriaceae bacterium]MBP9170160.1 hypothetical protein [Kofleriaceae bacterium]MBP9859845.1 hypothetical protein [Kofleriaceae bacterium]